MAFSSFLCWNMSIEKNFSSTTIISPQGTIHTRKMNQMFDCFSLGGLLVFSKINEVWFL